MTFDEWVSAQPLQVRRDLYELVWVKQLCEEAYNTGKQDIKPSLDALTDGERIDLFRKYCKYCGNKNPKCWCNNDE